MMSEVLLEHVNMTVSDPDATASMLQYVFGWKVRWTGPSLGGGFTVHVGTGERYIALYRPKHDVSRIGEDNYSLAGAVNHIGVLVDDLDAAEQRILAAGYKTHSHQEYEPGKRFYFHDDDGIEYEVVSYG